MDRHIGVIKLPINRLHMEITNICNFSCEFCPDSKMKRPRGMVSADMAKSIIDEVSDTGIARLILLHVMGEPMLHPKIVDIVEYASLNDVDVCITTNGSRLNLTMLNELQRAGVKKIIISLQTPDESTFIMRVSRDVAFGEYVDRIISVARFFIMGNGKTELIISFLSSPLRRLLIPIAKEFSIADTTGELKRHLKIWASKILEGTGNEHRLPDVLKQIGQARSYKENRIFISDKLSFYTRVLGDWSTHFDKRVVRARFGYCPGIQDNFGILWNGDYTFCCTDYEGKTTIANFGHVSIEEYLQNEMIQRTVRAFQRFRILHPYCQQCIGDRSYLNSFVKQVGSILYFKFLRGSSI